MTLAEALVAGTLFLLVGCLILFLLIPGWKAWMRGGRKSDVQQNSLVIIGRITQEFQNALVPSVSVENNRVTDADGNEVRHDSIVFLSNLDKYGNVTLTPDGDPLWQKRMVFYHDGDSNQVRSQENWLPSPTADPDPVKVPGFNRSPDDRIIARYVHTLELNWSSAPTLQVVAETRLEGFSSRFESCVLPLLVTFVSASPTPTPTP